MSLLLTITTAEIQIWPQASKCLLKLGEEYYWYVRGYTGDYLGIFQKGLRSGSYPRHPSLTIIGKRL